MQKLILGKEPLSPQSHREELDLNASINVSARYWQFCLAQAMSQDATLRSGVTLGSLDNRRVGRLVGDAARRSVRGIFGVVLRDVQARPEMFTATVAALSNEMVYEIGDMLSAFPIEERVKALEGLMEKLAAGMKIELVDADELPGEEPVDGAAEAVN